jgi:hypothetical protein
MKSSAPSTKRAQPSGIAVLLTFLSSSGYFPAATKIESQPRSAATGHSAAAVTGMELKTDPSDSSGYTRSEP